MILRIQVGAPKGSNPFLPQVTDPGAVYKCPFKNSCNVIDINSMNSKYIVRIFAHIHMKRRIYNKKKKTVLILFLSIQNIFYFLQLQEKTTEKPMGGWVVLWMLARQLILML